MKKTILQRKELKLCNSKLKQVKTKDQYLFCPGCFVDLLESGDIFSFADIASKFNLNPESVPNLLKSYKKQGKLNSVLDPIKKAYSGAIPKYRHSAVASEHHQAFFIKTSPMHKFRVFQKNRLGMETI